ncbi:MoaD/ThiS family protein [Leptospirillum ferriphilum]|uniref:Molybdopterin synthase sulfur carrier subunit n=1 Tax=Leptospirillum ferriphilum TaxID=178606 RepID=A0A2I2MHD8_9BACT|nr:MoaD/ThiS family protein [Leptospirillum ferriphilum]
MNRTEENWTENSRSSGSEKTVETIYFGPLREKTGRDREALVTLASTPRELYREIAARYGFEERVDEIRVAVGEEFCDLDRRLEPDDTVVFLFPFGGG